MKPKELRMRRKCSYPKKKNIEKNEKQQSVLLISMLTPHTLFRLIIIIAGRMQ